MKYLRINDLRKKLGGRARASIYRDVELGRLPRPFKLGSSIYWVESDIDNWLLKMRDDQNK